MLDNYMFLVLLYMPKQVKFFARKLKSRGHSSDDRALAQCAMGPRFKSWWIQEETFISPFSHGWFGHNINVDLILLLRVNKFTYLLKERIRFSKSEY